LDRTGAQYLICADLTLERRSILSCVQEGAAYQIVSWFSSRSPYFVLIFAVRFVQDSARESARFQLFSCLLYDFVILVLKLLYDGCMLPFVNE